MRDIVVVDYGAGNTRSVRAAIRRLGATSTLSADPATVLDAEQVILPGVGSAREAMVHLRATGASEALRARFDAGRPTLGICLGLQLALEFSDEDGGVETLSLVPGSVRRLQEGRIPRLGWAAVDPNVGTFYFAHSFACDSPMTVATSEGLAAIVVSHAFTGVQFHPEKSGPVGERWLATCLSLD